MDVRRQVGRYGEDVVARRLGELGWEVLERNWRCARGELDIVALDGATLVAVEVKTRRGGTHGGGLEALTAEKVARLRRLIALWLEAHDGSYASVRIDAVAVSLPAAGAAVLDHVRGIE
ncbi:YraN family protein [Demequina sp.]|uniref:YraN family protein n=1 Tax=Demequina sp. TaxID=2050685 RepID=UPI003A89EA0D